MTKAIEVASEAGTRYPFRRSILSREMIRPGITSFHERLHHDSVSKTARRHSGLAFHRQAVV